MEAECLPNRLIAGDNAKMLVEWPPRGPNAGVQFSFLQIIKHRLFLLWVSIYELEDLGSCAVLTRLAVLNIMRHPHPHPHPRSPIRGPHLGRSRTARAVQPCV